MRTPAPWSWKRSLARAAGVCALAALSSSSCPAIASAQAPPATAGAKSDQKAADRRARERFEKGRVAFSEGAYRDAWEHFREAYLLSKRPELLYNVGQSADRMRMDREALKAFKLYLEKLPNAANRKEVEARVTWLEENLAREANGGEVRPTTLDDSFDETSPTLATDDQGRPAAPETLPNREGEDLNDGAAGEDGAAGSADAVDSGEDAGAKGDGDGTQPGRTGWYLRLAAGLGVLADGLSDAGADSLGSTTLAGMVLVGYDIQNGVVIGGGVTFDGALAPVVRDGNAEQEIDTANLGTLVLFVDYFLEPRQHGWHLLGGLGVGSLALTDKTASVGIEDATGGSLMLGGGCEWRLNREWGIGGLVRLMIARLSTDVATHTAFAPSLAFTAAWY